MSESFHINLDTYKNGFPYCGPSRPSWATTLTLFYAISESLHVNIHFSGSMVLDRKIFKEYLYINTDIIGLTYCSPTRLLGPWFEEI
jgi:hypothetical protein